MHAALPRYLPTILTSKALPGISTKSLFERVRGSCFAFTATMVIKSKTAIVRAVVIINLSKSTLGKKKKNEKKKKKNVRVALIGLGPVHAAREESYIECFTLKMQ